ncbi:hypothetical protein, partial [Porphyromonas endodontalis]|uniref:hypothetical protein n=1 Tax=Porphyromonas endodontalis TaxID=28124 RepID=UPI0028E7B134
GTPAAAAKNKARGLEGLLYMKKENLQGQEAEVVTLQISEITSQSATTLSKRMAYNMPYKL